LEGRMSFPIDNPWREVDKDDADAEEILVEEE
jgi:hypothetical protein